MGQHLLLSVQFHGDGRGIARFHGVAQGAAEWPPAPARLFQALVAGVARGNAVPSSVVSALEWLEGLPPPVVAAPHRSLGQAVGVFVPNNDADSLADPTDPSSIRTRKTVQPSLFAADRPLHYSWSVSEGDADHAQTIVNAAADIYQLGRGTDCAWAVGRVINEEELVSELERYEGVVHQPQRGGRGRLLACPVVGSLDSLVHRHRSQKLRTEGVGKQARVLFTNPPKAVFVEVSYARAEYRAVYELRSPIEDKPWPWALSRAPHLVEWLRDEAAARLRTSLPGHEQVVEATVIGRKADGRDSGPSEERVRIVPLPSIGSEHADRAIRRFLLEVPTGGRLSREDLEWAFSGLLRADQETGEVRMVVVRTDGDEMLRHYRGPSFRWRSVTAVALPEEARRRRIEPGRRLEEAKASPERQAEEERAVAAVHVALRHAGIRATAVQVRVQREPFEAKGVRAEMFAEGTRFAKERLWHVELEMNRLLDGPLVIGDGRYLGLGVLAPVTIPWTSSRTGPGARATRQASEQDGILAFAAHGVLRDDPIAIAEALRRAVMARVQATLGRQPLPSYFTGHDMEGSKLASDQARHLAFHWDSAHKRLLVIAPHRLERRGATWEEAQHLEQLGCALDGFTELRAGASGHLKVRRILVSDDDVLVRSARCWSSQSPYTVPRHPKGLSAKEAIEVALLAECKGRSLPRPHVKVVEAWGAPGRGLEGLVQLTFRVAIPGPIVLGRKRYKGGGLFAVLKS